VIALAVAVIANQRSVQAAQASSMLAAVSNIFTRRNEPTFVHALNEIRAADFGQGCDPAAGFTGLRQPAAEYAYLVSNFFDDLGKLIAHKIIKEDVVIGTYGQAGFNAWAILKPYVEGQRVLNRSNFQIYFEHLANRVAARPPETIHKKLGLLK